MGHVDYEYQVADSDWYQRETPHNERITMTILLNQNLTEFVNRLKTLVERGEERSDEAVALIHALYDSAEYDHENLVVETGIDETFAVEQYIASPWVREILSEAGDTRIEELGAISIDVFNAIDQYATIIQEQGVVHATREIVDFTHTVDNGVVYDAEQGVLGYVYFNVRTGERGSGYLSELLNDAWSAKLNVVSREIAKTL